ncbi:MAG: amidohydrolase family protein [Halioglobus sp.]
MLITDADVAGYPALVDVRCDGGTIVAMGRSLRRRRGEPVLAAAGGALLPGLHDHHIHMVALAALHSSVQCGPPAVTNAAQLAAALRADTGDGWLRGVAYHESVAGVLDTAQLDRLRADRPVKIQHRSGKLWVVNSAAARRLELERHAGLPGIELDSAGRPNGRLWRLDGWMREQLARAGQGGALPGLAGVSRLLASFGVTGCTDATPDNGEVAMAHFTEAAVRGELLQSVRVMGGATLPEPGTPQVRRGERKLMLDESALPEWDALCAAIGDAHRQGRAVAVHCVTRAELVLALSALRAAGRHPGDRIEHASLVPADCLPLLREVGVRVITQPGFIHERGDQYLAAVPAGEWDDLYRCRALLAQGVPLAGSTDAPYGSPDPWVAMRAAVVRRSRAGVTLGPRETLTPEQALALFTCAADTPGGPARAVAVGAVADLCLLHYPWQAARNRLTSADVRATLRSGALIHDGARPSVPQRLRTTDAA